MIKIVGGVVIGLCAIVVVQQAASAVWGLYQAGTMNGETTGADLLETCGYDPFEAQWIREPTDGCTEFIRESLRTTGRRGIIKALVDGHARGQVCVGELLNLSDGELVRTYAEWAQREQFTVRAALSAETLISFALMDEYICRPGSTRRG